MRTLKGMMAVRDPDGSIVERSRERVKAAEENAKRLTKAEVSELTKRAALHEVHDFFDVRYFTDEADADLLSARYEIDRVKSPSDTPKSGYVHGSGYGRDPLYDFTRKDGARLHAYTC